MFNTQCCLSSLSALLSKVRRENIHKWIELEKQKIKKFKWIEEKVRSMNEYDVEMLCYVASKWRYEVVKDNEDKEQQDMSI